MLYGVLIANSSELSIFPSDGRRAVKISLSGFAASPLLKNATSSSIAAQIALGQDVLGAVATAGIETKNLELEITESVLLQDVDRTLIELKLLKEAGISLSIDDFGTGYSSLSYLKRFPIDTIKIDRSFVKDLHKDTDDAAICAAILAMSQQLGLNVVAEGVETREQLEFLQLHGCDHIQGYICSKPLPADKFFALLVKIAGKAANSDDAVEATA